MKKEGRFLNKKSTTINPSRIIQRFLASDSLVSTSYFEDQFQNDKMIYLDKNENPFLPPLGDLTYSDLLDLFKNYPDPNANLFLRKLSESIGIPISSLIAGSGSDELLDLIIRVYASPKDTITTVNPTFSMYKFYANINGSKYESIPLELNINETSGLVKFELNENAFIQKAKTSKIIILARPNNPDGMLIPYDFIRRLLELNKVVIIDEAYIDFSNKSSVMDLVEVYDNLIILRSFSKSYSLAGLRLGYLITSPSIKNILIRVKGPYNVNTIALKIGSLLLDKRDEVLKNISKIKSIRAKFYRDLIRLRKKNSSFYVHPSEGNFILLRLQSDEIAESIYQFLLKNYIKVRKFEAEISNCLRISIGTSEHMKKVIETLDSYFEVS
jgi:histidinol-phosphate aminotransferase